MEDRGSGAEERAKPTAGHLGDEQKKDAAKKKEEPANGEGPRMKEVGQVKGAGRGGLREGVEDVRHEQSGHIKKEQKKGGGGGAQPKGLLGRYT